MTKEKKIADMSYEEAMRALEETIAFLESESKSLDESLALFERGQELSKHCSELLKNAEIKIRTLTYSPPAENEDGELT